MILSDVMDELATQLGTISGLRVFGFPPDSVVPPAAIVTYPEQIDYDATYGRGADEMVLPLMVVVGKMSDRATRDLLSVYCDGSGDSSVKAVLEDGTYTSFDSIRVASVAFDVVTIGGTGYLNAEFTLQIMGQGA